MNYKRELEFAKNIAKNAGSKILEVYSHNYYFYEKNNGEGFFTEADCISNEYICNEIKKNFSKDGILSEENDDNGDRLSKNRVWCIDPLDGTKDFISKTGEFAVHIGLIEDQKPVLGVIYLPVFNKIYFGSIKNNAYLEENGMIKILKISDTFDLKNMILAGSRNHRNELYEKIVKGLSPIKEIIFGSLGVKAGLILEKKADFMFYPNDKTKEWDSCAPHAVINAAGGVVTGLSGENVIYNKKNTKNPHGILISNGKNHKGLINKITSLL